MKFGMGISGPEEPSRKEWERYLHMVDEAGIELVGVIDSQTRNLECYVHLTMIAMQSSRVRFGPVISNPVTRHPAVVATAFASLQYISGGRAFLGIATGNSAVRNLGLPAAKLEDVREHVRVVRALIRDGVTEYQGHRCELPFHAKVGPQDVPVYMAANGPKSLRLAGEIADGIIMGGGISKEVVELALGYIDEGARVRGKRVNDLDVWFQAIINIADSDQEAMEQMKGRMVPIASRNFRFTFEGKAVPKELEEPIRQMERDYKYWEHLSGGNAPLGEKYGLDEFLTHRWVIAGTMDTVVRRLEELESWGVRRLYVGGGGGDRFRFLEQLRNQLMGRVGIPG